MTIYRGHGLPTLALLCVFGGLALIASNDNRFFGYELERNWTLGLGGGGIVLGCMVLGKMINWMCDQLVDTTKK